MSGRRRTGAAASALNLLTSLVLQKQQDDRARQQKAEELAQEFKLDYVKEQIKLGALAYDPNTGRFTPTQPPGPPAGLEPSSYTDQRTGVGYERPRIEGAIASPTEERQYFGEVADPLQAGKPMTATGGYFPSTAAGRSMVNSKIATGQTESPAATGAQIVRKGKDTATGRSVGQTAGGAVIYLDTGEPYRE